MVKDFVPASRLTGVWQGEKVSISSRKLGHDITPEEFQSLCDGDSISFEAIKRDGTSFPATMRLGHREWNGRDFIDLVFVSDGTSPDKYAGTYTGDDPEKSGQTVRIKRSFRGVDLSESQLDDLLAGKTVKIHGCVPRGGGRPYDVNAKLGWLTFPDKETGDPVRVFTVVLVDDDDHVSGLYTGDDPQNKGRNIRFKRVFCGVRLTDEQCTDLLAGRTITVDGIKSKSSGRTYSCYAKLAWSDFKGRDGRNIHTFNVQRAGFVDD